jgi:hypothetical protein
VPGDTIIRTEYDCEFGFDLDSGHEHLFGAQRLLHHRGMMRTRTSPITCLLLFTLGATAATNGAIAQTAAIGDADSGWRAVSACAAQPSEGARHACLDDVLRRAGLLTPERETRQQREQFGLKAEARAPAVPMAVTPAPAPSGASPATSAPPAAPSTVDVELARISVTHDDKLILTTTDGAVWRQIEGGAILPLPAAGDRMTIRRASLGSYLCEVRRNVGFRCSRTR